MRTEDFNTDMLLENLSKAKPRLNEDLTPSILNSINSNEKNRSRTVYYFVRAVSSVAAILLLTLFFASERPGESNGISNNYPTAIFYEPFPAQQYLSHLQKNSIKNTRILSIRKKSLNPSYKTCMNTDAYQPKIKI